MTAMKKVIVTQFLRSEPKFLPLTFIDPGDGGGKLQVLFGEQVNVGAKPDVDETVDGRSFKWVFAEATAGQQVEKRKGFVSDEFLGPDGTAIPVSGGFEPFATQVNKEDFASTCYLQAALNVTNPAYLYALAFALSGDQWSASDVKTDDPVDAPAVGVFRFPKETWQRLISEPEATNVLPEEIKFPEVQCIVAAICAAKSAKLLKGKITNRELTALDLFLAHLFADTLNFGSDAVAVILRAMNENKTQSAEAVIKAIYPETAVRTAFFARNANIFSADGTATIEQAVAVCETALNAGFADAGRIASQIDSNIFGDNVPESSAAPIPVGAGNRGSEIQTTKSVPCAKNGIDRRQFLDELRNPTIVRKLADMVKGEVGWNAPHDTKIVQLETVFNRAIARGHSLAQALLSTSEDRIRGYYQGGPKGTYSRPATTAEFEDFQKNVFPEVVAGSNKSEELLHFIATGNASPPTSTEQYRRGTQGGDLPTALPGHPESYFYEPPFRFPFKRLQGTESISLPIGKLSEQLSDRGEPPEHMDGDTEGYGPPGGKFNVSAGTPIAPAKDHQTITLDNDQAVTVNKAVAEQFRGFFNDLVKLGAPVKGLGGFGLRGNPSEHPIGFAVDWAQRGRNDVASDVGQWIAANLEVLKKLELRWGLSGGENWHNPDTGHFSIERIFGAQHLKASKEASARG
ncbi:hypothetical protein ACVI1L_002352 [Bradyrhizobium sp. USDA 4516]